jgi:hypothetical protein
VLVWFAAFSNHCSLFPTASVVEAFKNELKGFSTSKVSAASRGTADRIAARISFIMLRAGSGTQQGIHQRFSERRHQKRQAKGRKLGRPRVTVDAARVAALRAQGRSWRTICRETGLTRGTAQRALYSLPQIPASSRHGFAESEVVIVSRGRARFPLATTA